MPDVTYPNYTPKDPNARVLLQDDGRIRVAICDDNGNEISRCWVLLRRVAIGKARTGMGGISYVSTDEEHRMKGLGRRLMQETNRFCINTALGLIMLYGIPNYYPKFGYSVCGPEYRIELDQPNTKAALPAGWSCRAVTPEDIPIIRSIYQKWIDNGCCGAHERKMSDDPTWVSLDQHCIQNTDDECMVVCSPEGEVEGYAWHCRANDFIRGAEQQEPNTLAWGEVMALNHEAADAVVAVCQNQLPVIAQATGREINKIAFSLPPHGNVARALRWGNCRFRHDYQKDAWFMARGANVAKLLSDMIPEFSLLLRKAGITDTELVIQVDETQYCIKCLQGMLSAEMCMGHEPQITLTSGELTQLLLGAYSVEEMYSRQIIKVSAEVMPVCQVLFPRRYNHIFVCDRF